MRARWMIVGTVVAALALAGCGGSGQQASGDSSSSAARSSGTGTAELADFSQVAAHTRDAGTSRLTGSVVTKTSGQTMTISMSGVFDYRQPAGRMTMKMAGLVPGSGAGQAIEPSIEEIIIAKTLYMKISGLPGAPTKWIPVDFSAVPGNPLGRSSVDPSQAIQQLLWAGNAQKVGKQTVGGVETTHYRGVIDLDQAMATAPAEQKSMLEKTRETLGAEFGKGLPFDAWVDQQGRLRKMVQTLDAAAAGQQVSVVTTIELSDFGVPVTVAAPPASQIDRGAAARGFAEALAGQVA